MAAYEVQLDRKRIGFALLYGHLGDTAEDVGMQLMEGPKEHDGLEGEDWVAKIIADFPEPWALELKRQAEEWKKR